MQRIERLQNLYQSTIEDSMQNGESWTAFLTFAAQIYKYSFDNTLLIYAQRPDATMLAPLPLWNQLGRYVRKGEKGIAVCDFHEGNLVISHLFDAQQTTGKSLPLIWNLDHIDESELAGRLSSYDTLDLSSCITNLTERSVTSTLDWFLQDFEKDIQDHFLGTLPLQGLEQHMQDIIQASVVYMVHRRCGLPEPEGLDFSTISHFSLFPLATRLGYHVTTIAQSLLQDIARYIKIMEHERSPINEGESESDLSRNRRSSLSRPSSLESVGSEQAALRQIRSNSDELLTQQSPAEGNDLENARRPDGKNATSGQGSQRKNGELDRTASSPSTPTSDRRYSSEDTPSESNQIDSRGVGYERHHPESEITKSTQPIPSPEPPASGSFLMPTDQEQNVRSEQDMLEFLLRSGMGSMQGKPRIYQFIVEHQIIKATDLIPILKGHYGIGGARGDLDNGLLGYMHDGKGIEISWKDSLGSYEGFINWRKVATTLLQLIKDGRYDDSFPPFPLSALEWTLFDYVEQIEQADPNEETKPSAPVKNNQSEISLSASPTFDENHVIPEDYSVLPAPSNKTTSKNFQYNSDEILYPSGPKSKYKRNVQAIQLLKLLESDQRMANAEEQQLLAGYVGWGGLANAFHPTASGWETEYQELKQLFDEQEYAAARNSTITAYYTAQSIIEPIYQTLQRFGLLDGENRKLLDPAMGTGNFFSVLPEQWHPAELHGVELDSITGRIARQLYPQANIHIQGFETTRLELQQFDVIIGNIPFNNIRVFDRQYTTNYLVHDYFFAKSMDLLKPGGILAFITSKGTLDKQDTSIRERLAQHAELIGAVRLPNTTFQALAGTEVTTDILFLQKRDYPINMKRDDMPEWVFTSTIQDEIPINQYFVTHPEMILGNMVWDRSMYGSERTTACVPHEGQDLQTALVQALGSLQAQFTAQPDISSVEALKAIDSDVSELRKAPPGTKNFTYILQQNQLFYCENGYLLPQDIKGKKAERIQGLCAIREVLLEVIQIQSREFGYQLFELEEAQQTLNQRYDRYVSQFGPINDRANTTAFADDDQLPLLRSIEDLTAEKFWTKAAVFFKPTIKLNRLSDHAETALEALQICLNQRLKIDLPYIAHLYGKSTIEVKQELGEKLFLNPQKYNGDEEEGWELDEEYLSGDVKHKLAYAVLKAQEYPDLFSRNVEALSRVQPPPLLPADIDFRIGSPWVPVRYYRDFMYQTFDTGKVFQNTQTVDVDYLEFTNTWRVSGKSMERDSIKVNQTYGTRRVNAYEIYESSLNLQSITVRDPVTYLDSNGNEQIKYVVNAKETMIARAKQQQLKEAFASWLFREKDRSETLLSIYNDKFNTIRPRNYDGNHLVFQGMNEEMDLRKHQKDVVARIVYSGTALMAHEVGAGKTAAMIAAGMYLKRIGAVQKPLYCVPNHLTEQWANEFLRFFPAANILVTTKKDFSLANRQRFVSRIAMGNYDAVIIGHSQFEKIPISQERQQQLLRDEIRNVSQMSNQIKREKGDSWSIKQMVVFENNLKSRLERLVNEGKKDNLLNFEQLGVDMLFVDEAHAYKNCFTFTKMRNVAGIGKSSSQRAMDMMLKCQYIQDVNQGRGVVFATGTPISNSMSEMYVMQRYLQPHMLQRLGLNFFDNWAATFGEVVSSLEINPEGNGYRMKSRFAKFHNLPELMNMFRIVADIQTAEMLQLPTPNLLDGKATVVVSECSPYQQAMMGDFVDRAEKIRNNDVNATEDNMLKLTHEAKLMSIDPRLVNEDAPSDPDSKLNRCIKNINDIWQNTQKDRLTQVVFCDSGTPNPGQFNVYNETKMQLLLLGIPEQEIAFIHDAKTDAQREELFEQVRRGEVRVLLGSTQKMGTGTNVQDRLIAAHHLDCPWRPSDITQRDGRILRQGNRNDTVQIFRYVTKGTFDSYLWQIQEQKLSYISQVMTGRSISRSCQDADETVLSAAEVKAIATANPLLAEKMQVDNEVIRLRLLKSNWSNEQVMLKRQIEQFPNVIQKHEQKIQQLRFDFQLMQRSQGKDFIMELDGKTYTERSQAGELLSLLFKITELGPDKSLRVGTYRGFELFFVRQSLYQMQLEVNGTKSYIVELGESTLGNITRIENAIEKIPSILETALVKKIEMTTQLETAKKEVYRPFEFEQKLNEMVIRQSEINSAIEFEELQSQEPILNEQCEEKSSEIITEMEQET